MGGVKFYVCGCTQLQKSVSIPGFHKILVQVIVIGYHVLEKNSSVVCVFMKVKVMLILINYNYNGFKLDARSEKNFSLQNLLVAS